MTVVHVSFDYLLPSPRTSTIARSPVFTTRATKFTLFGTPCESIQLTLSQVYDVLVHRVTRPLRGSVSCGSGWSVPCVSIQLTLSQVYDGRERARPLRGTIVAGFFEVDFER